MKKRYYAIAAGLAAALMMGGCSGSPAETSPAETSPTAVAAETEDKKQESESDSTNPTPPLSPVTAPDGEENYEGEINAKTAQEGPVRVWGTITEVGEDSILVNSESDTANLGEVMLLIDPDNTLILDAVNGLPVELKDVNIGEYEAYLGPAMTLSLPPQTTPYVVIVNIPEGMAAPQYVVASGEVDTTGGVETLTGIDGTEYTLARTVDVQPFLTKNIVQLEDITTDSRCLVWMNDESDVDRIVLFGE